MTTTRARRTAWHLRLWVGLAVAVGVVPRPGSAGARASPSAPPPWSTSCGATLFDTIAGRRPGFPARVLPPLLGLAAIELVIVAIPRTLGAGLVLFLLVVTFSTYVGGLRLGLCCRRRRCRRDRRQCDRPGGGPCRRSDAVCVRGSRSPLAVLTGRLTAERRRTAVALARLPRHARSGGGAARPGDHPPLGRGLGRSCRPRQDRRRGGARPRPGHRGGVDHRTARRRLRPRPSSSRGPSWSSARRARSSRGSRRAGRSSWTTSTPTPASAAGPARGRRSSAASAADRWRSCRSGWVTR